MIANLYARALADVADTDIAHTLHDARVLLKSETFNGVILDFGMPDGDGRELARELRDTDLRVLIMSGLARDEDVEELTTERMGILSKPPDLIQMRRGLGIWSWSITAQAEERELVRNAAREAVLEWLQIKYKASERERALVNLALDAVPTKVAAAQLNMTERLYRKHRSTITTKCMVSSFDALILKLNAGLDVLS